MIRLGGTTRRQAVALFTMKSFRARQKIPLTPQNAMSVFSEKLDPQDRLLRQSSVGAGASRFLVLDKNQRVRGVYHPLLCLPYPLDGAGVLGTAVESYVQRVQQRQAEAGPCTFVVVAHASGLDFATYAADGEACLPLAHVKLPAQRRTGLGMMNERDMRPFAETTSLVADFAEIIAENYTEHVHPCSTFFFLVSSNTVLSFSSMKFAWGSRGYKDTSLLSFDDRRWVSLSDAVALHNCGETLYCHDDEGDRVVSVKGLGARMKVGLLELDT